MALAIIMERGIVISKDVALRRGGLWGRSISRLPAEHGNIRHVLGTERRKRRRRKRHEKKKKKGMTDQLERERHENYLCLQLMEDIISNPLMVCCSTSKERAEA